MTLSQNQIDSSFLNVLTAFLFLFFLPPRGVCSIIGLLVPGEPVFPWGDCGKGRDIIRQSTVSVGVRWARPPLQQWKLTCNQNCSPLLPVGMGTGVKTSKAILLSPSVRWWLCQICSWYLHFDSPSYRSRFQQTVKLGRSHLGQGHCIFMGLPGFTPSLKPLNKMVWSNIQTTEAKATIHRRNVLGFVSWKSRTYGLTLLLTIYGILTHDFSFEAPASVSAYVRGMC